MTTNDPRRSPVGPGPGYGGGGWIAAFIVLIIIIAVLAWGWGGWWGGNGANNAANNPAPQATTTGSGSNTSGAIGSQRPGSPAPSNAPNNGNKTPSNPGKQP